MKTKLSHSACSKYQQCGYAYKLHYIEKIRPTTTSAALVMGSSMDDALNKLLLGETLEESTNKFITALESTVINGETIYVPTYSDLIYSNTDYDSDLFTPDDVTFVLSKFPEEKDIHGRMSSYKKKKASTGWESLTLEEKSFYNLMSWVSLKRKGIIILRDYQSKVLPKLENVREVQRKVSLKNADGDEIIGYVDLIADVKGEGTVILDNKTSSMEYDSDAVLTSPQLSLYVHILEEEYKTRKAGYIVMKKSLMKNKVKVCSKCGNNGSGSRHKTCAEIDEDGNRCGGSWEETISPETYIQFIVDEIPRQTEEIVLENYDAINTGIKNEVFHRNFNSCNNWYGSACPYLGLCYRKNMKGLQKV